MDVHRLTVGPLAEHCYLARRDADSTRAIVVDPGADAPAVLDLVERLGVTVEAILVTHCHVDHVGAVAPVARATGAPVHCAEVEAPILAVLPEAMRSSRMPARLGPFEAHEAEVLLRGGERLTLAGIAIDVLATPGHSPGHLVYAVAAASAAFSGDIVFAGALGGTVAPFGDAAALERSLRLLLATLAPETTLHPGHGEETTLARELAANARLAALAAPAATGRSGNGR